MLLAQCLVVTKTASDSPIPDFHRLRALWEIGHRAVRLAPYVPEMVQSDGTYDFSVLQPVIRAAWSLGFKIKLDPQWIPPQWSENKPCYMPYLDGPWWYNDPAHDFAKGFHYWGMKPEFAEVDKQVDKSFALHPTNIDPMQVFDFMSALAEEFAPYVWMWGTLNSNESGGMSYFPPIGFDNVNYDGVHGENLGDVVTTRYIPQLVVPSVRAIRGVIPSAIINIEDADGEGILDRVHSAYEFRFPPCWHLYQWDFSTDFVTSCLTRARTLFKPVVQKWRGDGPTHITESGIRPGQLVSDFLKLVQAIHDTERDWIDGIFALDPKYWFGDSWITGECKLTADGEAFKAMAGVINGKRRAAGGK